MNQLVLKAIAIHDEREKTSSISKQEPDKQLIKPLSKYIPTEDTTQNTLKKEEIVSKPVTKQVKVQVPVVVTTPEKKEVIAATSLKVSDRTGGTAIVCTKPSEDKKSDYTRKW